MKKVFKENQDFGKVPEYFYEFTRGKCGAIYQASCY